jgi:hypothetical protein
VDLAEFLEKVWEVVGRTALAQVLGSTEGKAGAGATGALEEDARLTTLFLWTLQSSNGEGARAMAGRKTTNPKMWTRKMIPHEGRPKASASSLT